MEDIQFQDAYSIPAALALVEYLSQEQDLLNFPDTTGDMLNQEEQNHKEAI